MNYLFASKSTIRHTLVGQVFVPEIEVGLTVDTWDDKNKKVEFNNQAISDPVHFVGSINQIKALIRMLEDSVAEAWRQMEMLRGVEVNPADGGGKDGE